MKTLRTFLAALACLGATHSSLLAGPPPVIQSIAPMPGTITALTNITVTFSEPVINVGPSELLVGGLPAIEVSGGGASWTFTLQNQPGYGTVVVEWDAGHNIVDLDEPANRFDETAPGASWLYNLVDQTPPVTVALLPAPSAVVRQLTQAEVTFSEAVAGVEAGDLLVNGSPASGLSVLGVGRYRFTFSQPVNGTVTLQWAGGHGIADFGSPPNPFAGGSWSCMLDPNAGLPLIRLNEFLASNLSGLLDENSENEDWIEIYNYGGATVNLAGYALTDDSDDPGKWTFPETNLAAGQYLVVFASAKDRKAPGAGQRFHTNFRLNPFGNYLALFNAESPRVAITEFAPGYPEQRGNHSYGYDTNGVLKYFATPTPGAANGGSAITGILPPPHFNVERGFYDAPFTLILNDPAPAGPGAAIRYTLNGSDPTATNTLYSGPLTITNTTVVRAAAFLTNLLPSVSVTHTYLFLDSVIRQSTNPPGYPTNWGTATGFYVSGYASNTVVADYAMDPEIYTNALYAPQMKAAMKALPVICLSVKIDEMFGASGIYANPNSRGVAWEKPCSMEFILPDGSSQFQVNAGVQIQGNAARDPLKQPKHPLKVLFKGDYGQSKLDYQMFPDSPVNEFDALNLRADFNFSWLHWSAAQRPRGQRTRDAWMKDSMRALGGLASHNRYTHLFINGIYWGIYDPTERPDEHFGAAYLGGTSDEYDSINEPSVNGNTAVAGDLVAYNAMRAITSLQLTQNYDAMKATLDVPQFCDFMLLHFYVGHEDWGFDKNWYAVRRRGAGNQFKYIPWDGENILGSDVNFNRVANADVPSGLHTNLLASGEYRLDFADRAHRALFNGGPLTPQSVSNRWMFRANQVDVAIIAETARWGDYRRDLHAFQTAPYELFTRNNQWLTEQTRLLNTYFPQRPGILLTQLRTAGLYPVVSAPIFNQHGGFVARHFQLTMAATNAIYYTLDGSDPRVQGTSAVSPLAQTYVGPVTLTNSVVVKARALFGTNWSALNEATFTVDAIGSPLRITEIMYNPIGGDAYEFVEVQNVSAATVNAGYWSIDGIGYIFPPNTLLAPGQIIVLGAATNPSNWTNRYPGVTVFGRHDGQISNGGEKLAIKDAANRVLWSVDYDDENGWPPPADGLGASLEIIDPFGDPDNPANWRASSVTNGTPGVLSAPPLTGSVVLNEVMANNVSSVANNGFFPDWVELYNGGASPMNLAGWSLTDDSNPRKFVFPSTNVPAGGYLVVWCDTTNTALGGLRAPFSLGANGEQVLLYNAATSRVDAIGFGIQPANYTIGRVGGAWTLTQPTTNATNIAVTLASTTNLVINEWLANAVPGGDDWVELYNRSLTAPVALRGIYLGISNVLHQLNALSFLAPGGYVQLHADGNPGANHLDFNLNATGETIVLYDETGVERNRVTFGPQAQGVSQGRLPDGASNSVTFSFSQSPEAGNYLLIYSGPFLNEVLAVNRSAVTNSAGRTADFVELRNTNGASFDLSGFRLSTDPGNASEWIFPAGSSIAGNSHLVVWFDGDRPATTVAGAYQNTGHALSGDGESVWLFNATGVPVDSVSFGFQVANLPLGRASSSNWVLLASVSPDSANGAAATLGQPSALRLNEWMAEPLSGADWFELFNPTNVPVALDGVVVADNPMAFMAGSPGLTTLVPLSFIGARGFVRIVADGDLDQGPHHVSFNLDGEGESLRVFTPAMSVIDTVYFGQQQAGVAQGRLPDGQAPMVSFPASASPGESNYLPPPYAIINEVLTAATDPLEDAVEIYNPSALGADLSGWFLSDNAGDLRKFRIPDGTMLPAGGFAVFYQTQFNSGAPGSFSLDGAHGGQLFLTEADSPGNVTGYRDQISYGTAENGVSFGRLPTCNGIKFTALAPRTFGQDTPASLTQFRTGVGLPNGGAKTGPVVIHEIHYHPPDLGGVTDDTVNEFIELRNITAAPVPLFDPAFPSNTWRLGGGVSFTFPTNITLAATSQVLVVSFNPTTNPSQLTAFRSAFGISAGLPIYGPWSGKLDNGGEALELYQPGPPQLPPQPDAGFVPSVLVDRVEYSDLAPWPVGGDGDGQSLQRIAAHEFGDDAGNWAAAGPTPGAANTAVPPATAGPVIIEHPYSRVVATNSRVVFSVAVCGSRPLTWQWKKGGVDISGATNATFIIASAQPSDAATYTVAVTNAGGGVIGGPAVLALGLAPTITSQPVGTNVGVGSPFTLAVAANGTAVLSYQWRLNGILLPGATGAVYAVASAQAADAGDYSVVVANGVGVAISAAAQAQIVAPLLISLQPVDQAVNPGVTVNFSTAGTGTGPVRYQWLLNGAPLPGETNTTLTLTNANLGQEGEYRCQLMDNVVTVFTDAVRLRVKVAPFILVRPVGATNATGSALSFFIECSGSKPMGFEWRQGVLPRTNIVVNTTNCTFTIPYALPATSGTWRVVITNSGQPSPVINSTFSIVVLNPPAITNPPVSLTVNAGTNASFSVVAGPTNLLAYQWFFLNAPLASATNATLNLTNVQFGNSGDYFVVVTNVAGSATSPVAALTVNGRPVLSEPEFLGNGSMRFKILGVPNRSYFVDISSNLPNWTLLTNLLYTNGLMPFTDTTTPGATNRFYRLRE